MSTLIEILTFVIRSLASVYLIAIVLRFLMQIARADFYNPISQLIVKVTSPILVPLRKVIPGLRGIDFASVVFALLFHFLVLEILILLMTGGLHSPLKVLLWSFLGCCLLVVHIYLILFFIIMIASFVAPHSRHPALMLIYQIAEPVLAPLRRLIPPTGGLDLSMFFAGLALYVIRIAILGVGNSVGVPWDLLLGSI